ncbi:MAG: BspA family leucine-rich repeat surface protein [Allomuricauda sp.]
MNLKKLALSLFAVAALWSCSKDDGPSTPTVETPTITSFSPTSGPVGTIVTINGTNFSTTPASNTVKFGTTTATVGSATATKLTATVPEGATTGKVSVTVGGKTATSSNDFTVVQPVNQAPTAEDKQLFTVAENISDTDEIGLVAATDPEGDDLTFSITTNDNDLFEITATGLITLADGKALDFETATEHVLVVSVSDGETSVSVEVQIGVENVIESMAEDPASYITTWNAEAGIAIRIYLYTGDIGADFTVDWGDGTVEDISMVNDGTFGHTYETDGTYTVAIQSSSPLAFVMAQDLGATPLSLASIEQWGSIQWGVMTYTYFGCANMVYNATDVPDLTNVGFMDHMFASCTSFNGDIGNWDTSNVQIMNRVFTYASSFNADLSGWDTSSVTAMNDMFYGATSFNGDISGWDTSNVTDMGFMFSGATSFNGDISGWDTSNVTDMEGLFQGASSFDQNLGSWNIGSVTSMTNMLDNSGMSPQNLNATLIGWHSFVQQNNGPNNIELGLEGLTFCGVDSFQAAFALDVNYGWNIVGATFEEVCN